MHNWIQPALPACCCILAWLVGTTEIIKTCFWIVVWKLLKTTFVLKPYGKWINSCLQFWDFYLKLLQLLWIVWFLLCNVIFVPYHFCSLYYPMTSNHACVSCIVCWISKQVGLDDVTLSSDAGSGKVKLLVDVRKKHAAKEYLILHKHCPICKKL